MDEIASLRLKVERMEHRLRMMAVVLVMGMAALSLAAVRPAASQQVPQLISRYLGR